MNTNIPENIKLPQLCENYLSSDESDTDIEEIILDGVNTLEEVHKLLKNIDDDTTNEINNDNIRTKNEILLDSIPREPQKIQETTYNILKKAGIVYTILDNKVIISSYHTRTSQQLGTSIYFDNGYPIGCIEDVFGNIDEPYYVVYFCPIDINSSNTTTISCKKLENDMCVYYNINDAQFVSIESIQNIGCDASNMYDEAIDSDEREFSDDEQEELFRRKKRTNNSLKKSSAI